MNERSENSAGSESSPRRSKSRVNTALLIIAVLLVSMLIGATCFCALGIWWFSPRLDDDGDRARQLLTEIVEIDIPDAFRPRGSIQWNLGFVMNLRGVYYEPILGEGVLTIVEVDSRVSSNEDVRRHIRETLLARGAGGTPLIVDEEKTTRKLLEIHGEQVPFTFEFARDPTTNRNFHLVEGVFAGKSGDVLLALRMGDEHWNEELILEMLNSIGGAEPLPAENPE